MEQAEDQTEAPEEQADPFAGLGKALKRLRKRAGFATQLVAAAALNIDKGQLSRWENEVPRPSLENLSRLLAGYGATVADLAEAMEQAPSEPSASSTVAGEGGGESDLIRSLVEAIRRVEGRQEETDSRVERIERGLEAAARPLPHSRPGDR
jgi:transcriptional regulator with XRE-family HTH domain